MTTLEAVWYMISVVSVCLSVCLSTSVSWLLSKKGHKCHVCSCVAELPSSTFICTRWIAPQTMHHWWSGLRL